MLSSLLFFVRNGTKKKQSLSIVVYDALEHTVITQRVLK